MRNICQKVLAIMSSGNESILNTSGIVDFSEDLIEENLE